jgi:hypothetical protein
VKKLVSVAIRRKMIYILGERVNKNEKMGRATLERRERIGRAAKGRRRAGNWPLHYDPRRCCSSAALLGPLLPGGVSRPA